MRLRNLIVLLGAMLAIGFSIIFVLRDRKRAAIRADAEVTFSRLATCLVGSSGKGKHFAEGLDDARARESIDPRGTDWPKRCRQYTDDAIRAHDRAFSSGVVTADGSIGAVADALDRNEPLPGASLDGLAPLWTSIPSEVPQPRAALAPAALSALAPIHGVMASASIADFAVRGSTVHLVLMGSNDRDPPRVACEVDPKLEALSCAVPPPAPIFDVLARDRGVEPLYVKFDAESRAVVIDAKGTELIRLPSFGYGYAFADGRVAVMSYGGEGTGDRLVLVREASGATTSRSVAGIADRFRTAGSWIVWKELDPDQRSAPAKVLAFDVASSAPTQDLGVVERRAEGGSSSGDCRSDTHAFVDLSPALAIHDPEKGWSMIEQTPRPQYGTRSMACHGDTLTMVDATVKGVVVQTCTVAGCTKKEATVAVDPGREFNATMIGDDVLLVWTSGQSLYAMRAPIEKLPDAPIVELVHAASAIVPAHRVQPDASLLGSGPPPPPVLLATPEGVIVFVMGKDVPTLSAVVVPKVGAPHVLASK